jgi:peptidyl-prolyl cis-trans isomerase D
MRRKKRLKAVLWLVIFALGLGMLLLFVPGQNVQVDSVDATAASVDGEQITMKEFADAFRRTVENYSDRGKNSTDPEILKAMGLGRQTLDALINLRVTAYAAKQLGLSVSPQELNQAIMSLPTLQDRGEFVGVERYKALLASQNIAVTEFEESMQRMLLANKVRNVFSDSMEVNELDLRDIYERMNLETQVSFVVLKREDFAKRVTPTEAELRAHFDANKERYHISEKRRAQYLLLPLSALAATLPVSQKEIEEQWAKQPMEETIEASQILFAVKDPAKEAEVKAKAEEVLKRAKAGEDFAALAKAYSDDPDSKQQGGSLGVLRRGLMAEEFDNAAFALKPGEISDLVRTEAGFGIIKVSKHDKPSLESSRKLLEEMVKGTKASILMRQKAAEAQKLAQAGKDFNVISKTLNVPTEIRDTGLLAKDSDPVSSGISQAFLDELFQLKGINSVGKYVDHPLGDAIPKLTEVTLPRPSEFTEARPRVERDYIDAKASELLLAESKKLSQEAIQTGDLEKTAKKFGFATKTPSPFKRDATPDPDIGVSSPFNTTAFNLPVGAVSPPVNLEEGKRVAILQVKSRTPFDQAAFDKQKGDLRERMLGALRDNYYQEYLRQLTESLQKSGKIRINPKAVDQVAQIRNY